MDLFPEFVAAYEEKINSYLEMGYARKLTQEELKLPNPKTFYRPDFMAVNPEKANKFRFVASSFR